MRLLPVAAAACMLVACVGLLVAYTALPHASAGNVELESAGDLIREAQRMKVIVLAIPAHTPRIVTQCLVADHVARAGASLRQGGARASCRALRGATAFPHSTGPPAY